MGEGSDAPPMVVKTPTRGFTASIGRRLSGETVGRTSAGDHQHSAATRESARTERASRHISVDADNRVWDVTAAFEVAALLERATHQIRVADIEAEGCATA